MMEKWSSLKLIERLRVLIENHCQLVIVDSCPEYTNRISGGRLVRKASLTAFLQ